MTKENISVAQLEMDSKQKREIFAPVVKEEPVLGRSEILEAILLTATTVLQYYCNSIA